MKKLTKILCALLVVLTMSCAKDGATGPQGPAGTNGTNGTNGNANVTVYNFDTDFILSSGSSSKSFTLPITQTQVDESLILGFYKDNACGSQFWYQSAGLGCSGSYQARAYMSNSTANTLHFFQIYDVDGSSYSGSSKTFLQYKVIVIASSSIINLRTSKPLTQMSYDEVCDLLQNM